MTDQLFIDSVCLLFTLKSTAEVSLARVSACHQVVVECHLQTTSTIESTHRDTSTWLFIYVPWSVYTALQFRDKYGNLRPSIKLSLNCYDWKIGPHRSTIEIVTLPKLNVNSTELYCDIFAAQRAIIANYTSNTAREHNEHKQTIRTV